MQKNAKTVFSKRQKRQKNKKNLENNISPNSITLFGSYEKGEDTPLSDIDLFIEAKEQQVDFTTFEKN